MSRRELHHFYLRSNLQKISEETTLRLISELKEELELESALTKLEVDWKAIGGSFEIEEARKRVIVRSRTSPLSLTESIRMEEEMERERINQFLGK